jgi:carbonic anhydrase/acetyltransferase-like protein (isoleucine patch superfamily)
MKPISFSGRLTNPLCWNSNVDVNIMTIYALGEKKPEIALSAYVHPQASVIGDVKIGERVFVAPMASIRGDRGRIEIGDETNVQDGAVIHSESHFVTKIGQRVNIGHNATVHAESVEDNAAIGSKVAEGVMIANSALLHNKTRTEPYKIYAGVPAKYMRDLDPKGEARKAIDEYLDTYVANCETYRKDLREADD